MCQLQNGDGSANNDDHVVGSVLCQLQKGVGSANHDVYVVGSVVHIRQLMLLLLIVMPIELKVYVS